MRSLLTSFVFHAINMSKPGQAFYAVRTGKIQGIFFKWSDCETQVKGFQNARYKKFSTVQEAADFVLKPDGAAAAFNSNAVQLKRSHSTSPSEEVDDVKRKCLPKSSEGTFIGTPFEDEDGIHVYTDGGCFNNGKLGAQAGIGVYWGDDHCDNVSESLPGRPTNNRAEIHAAVKAVEIAQRKGTKNLIIHTDSMFVINGITKWIKNWKKNNWKLSTGGPVINKDDFLALEDQLKLKGINTKWVHVKGHSGDRSNDAVDLLAKQGASKSVRQS